MTTKLIQTEKYLLLIDEEAEIKEHDCCLVTINGGKDYHIWIYLYYNGRKDYTYSDLQGNLKKWGIKEKSKIIAYYPLSKEAKELDLPLLPPFEEVDIERLAKINSEYLADWQDKEFYITSFIEGYKAAQSKQFSLEDIKKAMEYGMYKMKYHTIEAHEEFIQSLSTQQLPKEFIPEYEAKVIKHIPYPKELEIEGQDYEKGYPVTANVLKTITNSEGKDELVGTYKY